MLTLEYEAKLLPERMEYPHDVGVMRCWSRRFLQLFGSALLAPFGSVLRALLGNADSLRCFFYQLCSGLLCFASLVFPETKCSLRVWRGHKGLLTNKETWHRRKRREYLRLADNSDAKIMRRKRSSKKCSSGGTPEWCETAKVGAPAAESEISWNIPAAPTFGVRPA